MNTIIITLFMAGLLIGFIIGILASGQIIKELSYKVVDHIEERVKEVEEMEKLQASEN